MYVCVCDDHEGEARAYLYEIYSAYLRLYDTFIYNIPFYVYFQEYSKKGLKDVQPFCYWWSFLAFVEIILLKLKLKNKTQINLICLLCD